MRRVWAIAIAILVTISSAHAFDAFGSTGPGTHLGSAFDALTEAFALDVSRPSVIKSMPMFGIPTYGWPNFRGAELFCEAARDIDIFLFGPLYPHAQTPDFNYGRDFSDAELERIEVLAIRDYLRHMAGTIERARGLFNDGRPREATYLLGFVTHSYQDLWAHRGITNGMHRALLAQRGIDVDREAGRMAELSRRLPSWFRSLPELLGEQGAAFEKYIRSSDEVLPLTLSERKRVLGRGRDIFVQGPIYLMFAAKSAKALRYVERIEWDVDALNAMLCDRSTLNYILALDELSDVGVFLRNHGYKF